MIKFSTNTEGSEGPLKYLFNKKRFELISFKAFLTTQGHKLLLINTETSPKQLSDVYSMLNENKNYITFFCIPKELKSIKVNNSIVYIFYPIHISDFQKKIDFHIKNFNISFKDIFLDQSSFMINRENQNKTYLTEAEKNILKFLFLKNEVIKDELKQEILNLNPLVETRSLESHLSRIRKKIKEIKSSIKIISDGQEKIKII